MRIRVIVLCCAMLPFLACSCNASPTATYEPIFPTPVTTPTALSSPAVKTSTPTVNPSEPHVTYSPTQPDPTPRPTNTPTPCGTCEPLHPALYGSVIVQSWEDTDRDGVWQMYAQDGVPEWGVASTVMLMYASDLPLDVWNVTGVRIPVTWRGIAVYTTLLPGLYNVTVYSYEDTCLVPYYDNDLWAQVNAAGQAVVRVRFWRKPGCDMDATPGPTPTPSVTPTPLPYPCPLFSTNCLPSCPGNLVIDPRGQCGAGFVCCVPAPTRTVTP